MRFLLAGVLLLLMVAVSSSQLLELELESVEGQGLYLEGLSLTLDLTTGGGVLEIDTVVVAENTPPIYQLRLECAELSLNPPESFSCSEGVFSLDHSEFGRFVASVVDAQWSSGQEGPGSDSAYAVLDDVRLLGDGVSIQLAQPEASGQRQLRIQAPSIDLVGVSEGLPLPGLALEGRASLDASIVFSDTSTDIQASLKSQDLGFEDAALEYLGAAIAGQIGLNLTLEKQVWKGSLTAEMTTGELLTPYAYLAAEAADPVLLKARIASSSGGQRVQITDADLRQSPWLRLDAQLDLGLEDGLPRVERMSLDLPSSDLSALVSRYLDPVLANPFVSAATFDGRVSANIQLAGQSEPRIRVGLDNVSIEDDPLEARYSIDGLDGQVVLGSPGSLSSLSFKTATLYQIQMGETLLPLKFNNSRVSFAEPTRIPVFDGALDVERFEVDWREEIPDVDFDAVLEPVSMPLVAEALGWIPMQGGLSGVIPRVSLKKGVLEVGGSLLVRVFDGNLVVNNLKIQGLFSYLPVLTADVTGRNLDLEMLTGTYEFGRITGRLEGDIAGLRLEDWQPVSFDARFQTPENDRSRHRISQRAVDNIAGLAGGGATGAVSRGFLRFFDEFKYDRLGISCRLRRGVCEMGGVEPAKNGYYLVKGGGIPRIDVIGFNRSTDWETLVQRVLAAAEGGAPVIE